MKILRSRSRQRIQSPHVQACSDLRFGQFSTDAVRLFITAEEGSTEGPNPLQLPAVLLLSFYSPLSEPFLDPSMMRSWR
jgi:hypothetical protein